MFSEKMQVVLGSQYHEHLREWVGSTGLRSLYIHTLIYLHKHAYIYSDICSIYISVKAGVLQKLAFKKFYINMSQCLTNFVGLRALRENCGFPTRRTSFLFPPKLHKVPWISVPPMQRITWDGDPPSHGTAHLCLFAFISIVLRFLRAARHGRLTESTRCLLSPHAGDGVSVKTRKTCSSFLRKGAPLTAQAAPQRGCKRAGEWRRVLKGEIRADLSLLEPPRPWGQGPGRTPGPPAFPKVGGQWPSAAAIVGIRKKGTRNEGKRTRQKGQGTRTKGHPLPSGPGLGDSTRSGPSCSLKPRERLRGPGGSVKALNGSSLSNFPSNFTF